MRRKLNLDNIDLSKGWSNLWHGDRAAGKTHLVGDMLRTEQENGPVVYINISGEDNYLTLKGMGLGDVGELLENYEDIKAFLKECESKITPESPNPPYQAGGLDSLKELCRLVMLSVVGTPDRLPKLIKATNTSEGKNEWGEYYLRMDNLMAQFKRVAKYFAVTCASDKSINQLTGETRITPDLTGRLASGSAGWFNFVGYVQVFLQPPGADGTLATRRKLFIAPNNLITVRQTLVREITKDIDIPSGKGGWQLVRDTILKHAEVGGQVK